MSPLRNSHDLNRPQKISGSPNMNFRLGGPDPQRGDPSPKLVGALHGDPEGARFCERTAAISLTVTEKIAFEKFFSTPPSGETVHHTDPISRTTGPLVHAYIVLKFHVPRPPRSDAIRLYRNLEMPYYGNERHRRSRYIRAPNRQK